MKKRMLGLALCLLLLLAQTAQAAPTVCFTSVNDMLLDLASATMPFYADGELYVPSAVFEAKSGKTPELGIFFNHDRHSNLALLYRGGEVLVFDLAENRIYDNGSRREIEGAALVRSDTVFFPMDSVADFFALDYSYTKVTYGYLLRVKNSAVMLSDAEFIAAAENPMRQRYTQYARTEDNSSNGSAGTETADPAGTGVTVSLLVGVGSVQSAGGILTQLERYGARGALVFDPEDMAGADDLLRRTVGSGHAVVLAADGTAAAEEVLAQLAAGNEALYRAAVCRTRLVYLENAAQPLRERLAAAGYEVLTPLDLRALHSAQQMSNRILAGVSGRRSAVNVYLGEDAQAAVSLGGLLSRLWAEECTLAALRERP